MDTPQEIVVQSWNELMDALYQDSWSPEIGRFRSRYAFRGLSQTDYQLETTLMRLQGDFTALEHHLLRNFRKYAHRSVVEQDSVWNWLSIAQHYGLPTRLLDWTYSPFVALHFATANIEKFQFDGAIWAVNYVKSHLLLPDPLKQKLDQEGANVFTVEMLAETLQSLRALSELSEEDYVIFFEPPSIDDRITNQFAFFSMMPRARSLLDTWLQQRPHLWRKIIIPAHLKWEIRDKLDQANITERVLFPGMDGLSRWLKRHYSPRYPADTKSPHDASSS
ncbi:MAG: FRG domain-containing protein [Myxococcales bacterium]|nr:FRG domain-containing protein [Myxococcales bacterium]